MSIKRVLIVLILVTALPAVLSFNFHIEEIVISLFSHIFTTCVYDLTTYTIYGEKFPLIIFSDHPLLFINIPFEPDPKRLSILSEIQNEYGKDGLRILVYPTDEFSETKCLFDYFIPPSEIDDWIKEYHLSNFDIYQKVFVNGRCTDPVWNYLKIYFDIINYDIKEDYTIFLVANSGLPEHRISGTWNSSDDITNKLKPLM